MKFNILNDVRQSFLNSRLVSLLNPEIQPECQPVNVWTLMVALFSFCIQAIQWSWRNEKTKKIYFFYLCKAVRKKMNRYIDYE